MQKIQGFTQAGNTTLVISGAAGTIVRKVQGSFPSATITVYLEGTVTLASIFSDDASTPKANPFVSASDGTWFFYVADGNYDVKFSGGSIGVPFTIGALQAFDVQRPDLIRHASQFSGADAGAQINAAIADLPATGGVVDARGLIGAQSSTALITVPANVTLLLSSNVLTCTNATGGIRVVGSASISVQNGGIYQEPGGIIKYTGAGAAVLLVPGAADNFINGFIIDIDTIDCNGTGAYGIQCSGAGWVQHSRITFKRIWHFTASGLDFQLGRKNGNMIYGVDIDGSNVAGTAELGVIGVNFEDSTAQAGYNLYEANHIEIATVRNTTSYPLRVDFFCGHNYFCIDCGNDYSHVSVPIFLSGNSNTLIIKGVNPWFDIAGGALVGGAQTWYPTIQLDGTTLAATNVISLPPKFFGGIIDENLLGTGAAFLGPTDQENFLNNCSFENVDGTYPIGWTATLVVTAAIGNQAKHGRLCLRTAVAAATVGYIAQSLPSWMAGKTVTACVWVKNDGGTGVNSGVQALAIFDDVGIGGNTENYIIKSNLTSEWYYLLVTKAIPVGATTIQLRLYADRAGTNVGGQNVLWDAAGVYFGIAPTMPTTVNTGAIGKTIIAKDVGIGTAVPQGPLDVNGGWWIDSLGNAIFNSNAAITNNLAAQSLDVRAGSSSILHLQANGGAVDIGVNTPVPTTNFGSYVTDPKSTTLANGANNNIAVGNKEFLVITGPAAGFSITGFTGGLNGQSLTILNPTGQQMTLTNNSGASTQKILTLTGADIVLRAGSSACVLKYSTTLAAWFPVATPN